MYIQQLKDHVLHIEKQGALSKEVLQTIYDHKLFKLFLPEALGGLHLTLPEGARIFQQMAKLDGNLGWLVTIGTGGNAFASLLTKDVSEKIYGSADAVIAGSGYPTGKAVEQADGYVVTGEWKYCSGSTYATTFTMNCFIERDGEVTADIISCAIPAAQVEVIEDWAAMGMKATASHTIRVQHVFVAKDYTFQLGKPKNDFITKATTFQFTPFSETSFLSVCLGLTESYLEEAAKITNEKLAVHRLERHQQLIGEIEQQRIYFSEVNKRFNEQLNNLWYAHVTEGISEEALAAFSKMSTESASACLDICHKIFRKMGMEAILTSTRLNQIWRDLQTASQHGFLTAGL